MKYDLKDIATVSGLPGLFKVVSPSKNGVILEAIDETKKRMMTQTRHQISLLQEISIFTTGADSVPLEDVFENILKKHKDGIGIDHKKASGDELKSFIGSVVSDYDEERVYTSDIKKLINWYGIVSKNFEPVKKEAKKKDKEEGDDVKPSASASISAKDKKKKVPQKKVMAKPKATATMRSTSKKGGA